MDQFDLYAAFFGEDGSLCLCGFRKVEREDVEPLFGEPDAVARFAVGDG
jgi:hypothetical protein